MSKFREFVNAHPLLDKMRIGFVANFFHHSIHCVDTSYSLVRVAPNSVHPYIYGKKQAIFAMYHGRLVGSLRTSAIRKKVQILVSQSRDGEMIARALEALGFSLARGSPARGGVKATKTLIRASRAGSHLILAVDGPKGPLFEVKEGPIRIAEMTGLPIVPFVCAAREHGNSWGWDSFLLPHWGTSEVFLYGEPIEVPKHITDEERERIRLKLDESLTDLRMAADSYWQCVAPSSTGTKTSGRSGRTLTSTSR